LTEENKKKNIKAELEQAEEVFRGAVALKENGFFKDAVSRFYYAAFHTLRAALLTKGLEPKTHEGCDRLLHRDFVKPGLIEMEAARIFSTLMKYREESDYNPFYTFTKEDCNSIEAETRRFIDDLRGYIKRAGYE